MNEDTKFPEACHHSESAPETHIAEDVDDWFKACMADFPNTGELDSYDNLVTIHRTQGDFIRWYMKWFSQFKEDE